MTRTTTDPEAAAREAAAAHRAVDEAERAVASGKKLGVSKYTEILGRARYKDLEAEAARAQAELDREQGRQDALAALATEIDALAGTGAEGLADALGGIADAVGRARRAAVAWDAHLAEVAAAARDLGCREPASGGPREADQRVAASQDGTVCHAESALKPVSSRIKEALQHALDGDVVSAVAAVEVCSRLRILARADHYLRGRGGMILPVTGELNEHQRYQVRTGGLVELTESQIRAHLAGDPFELTKAQEDMYRAGGR